MEDIIDTGSLQLVFDSFFVGAEACQRIFLATDDVLEGTETLAFSLSNVSFDSPLISIAEANVSLEILDSGTCHHFNIIAEF